MPLKRAALRRARPRLPRQGEADRWTLRVRLAVKGASGPEARLEGLAGDTRVAEILLLAAKALGVPTAVETALRLDARVLRGQDTLAEAGVVAGAGQVWVAVGEAGGMPSGCFGFGGQQQAVDELRARVREAEARADEEKRRHAEAEAQLQVEVQRLRTAAAASEQTQQTVDALLVRVRDAEGRAEVEARRHAEAEARWKEERNKTSEEEAHLKAEAVRLEASRSEPHVGLAGQLEAERRRHTEAEARLQAEVERLSTLSSGARAPAAAVQQGQATSSAVSSVTAQVMLLIADLVTGLVVLTHLR